jgi:beta-1,4-mannooligosaccharide/beta-1,4-mannosyl-N-acetylglucosamine phosphorylase
MKDIRSILERHPANPLLSAEKLSGVSQIFNPGVAQYDDKTILALSVVQFDQYKHDGTNRGGITRIAESENGINFTICNDSFIELEQYGYPYNEIFRHTIDNRISLIEDKYYLITPVAPLDHWFGPVGLLGYTKDFKTYHPMEIISLPANRGISLFPEKINGKYYRLDRPMNGNNKGHIWLSSSPDLIHWGCHRPVLAPYNYWNSSKIGPTPPIKTEDGWLVIIHGVSNTCGGTRYYIGAILLSLDEPWRVTGKTASWLLAPEMPYETCGEVNDVVFPCGALTDIDKDLIRIYYGAADTRVCLASGKISEIIKACIDEV